MFSPRGEAPRLAGFGSGDAHFGSKCQVRPTERLQSLCDDLSLLLFVPID
jgi:hypothetical protein